MSQGLNDAWQYLWAGGAGLLGRLMYHAHLFQRGERKSLVWIVCDLLIALGMGWITLGVGAWLDVSWQTSQSLAIMAGWAGPQLINQTIDAALDRYRRGKDEPKEG
jgi:hypothetical protein